MRRLWAYDCKGLASSVPTTLLYHLCIRVAVVMSDVATQVFQLQAVKVSRRSWGRDSHFHNGLNMDAI